MPTSVWDPRCRTIGARSSRDPQSRGAGYRARRIGGQVMGRGAVWEARRSGLVVAAASLVGVAAFLYPFLLPVVDRTDDAGAHAADAPLVFAGLSVLCLLAALATLGQAGFGPAAGATAKSVALLGVLVATDATLRLAPSLLGATPIFLLII